MDIRLKNNVVIQVVGPSGSGKTFFVTKLLQGNMFREKIGKIYWHHGADEIDETNTELKKITNIELISGFPEGWMDTPKAYDVLVIDDLFEEANKVKNFNSLFTKVARHSRVTVIYLTQNLFHAGGQHRTRNLNVHYLVLFKNPRDQTAIEFIARQARSNFIVGAYHDATANKPHGYLFMDFTQECPDEIRVRTDIFNVHGVTVYKHAMSKWI